MSGTAGGTVYGALEVLAGQGARVKSGRALVRLEETEEVEGEAHDDEESHVDVEVVFNEASGWQKWDGVAAVWAQSPEAPTSAPADGGHYRYLIPWNTASGKPGERLDEDGEMVSGTLLGHNGSHEVSLLSVDDEVEGQVTFTSANGGEFGAEAPEKVEVEIGNLVIKSVSTSNGTQDYFKFDPDSEDGGLVNPTITFEIEDGGDKHRYQWWLWVTPTRSDEPNTVAFTGIMPSDGSKTVTINASDPQGYTQEHPLTQWGTYTFDLRIKEVKANSEEGIGEPLMDLRSRKLTISQHGYEVRMNEDDGEMKAFVAYTLQSERVASEGKVAFLDAEMQEKNSVPMQLQPDTPQKDVELYTFGDNEKTSDTQQDATYRAIFTATDDFAKEYRDHRNRDVVVNDKDDVPVFHAEDDWMPGAQYPSNIPGNGALQPQVGGERPRRAFYQAGWLLYTRANSPTHVNPAYCNEIPEMYFSSRQDAITFSTKYFNYISAVDRPSAVSKNKFFRYVHVLGCEQLWPRPVDSNEPEGAWGFSSRQHRMAFVSVGKILGYRPPGWNAPQAPPPNWDNVQKVTIHELGHQFLSGGHDHGIDNPDTPYDEGQATAAETLIYLAAFSDPEALKALKYYRTYSAQAGQQVTNRDGYLRCVMDISVGMPDRDWRFCGYHRSAISRYSWPKK